MTTYCERREARADRLRDWAGKREAKAESDYEQAARMADAIPFGQPILIGHHSEGRDRRYRDRIGSAMDRSVESQRKADSMNSRAATIEAQLAGSIYSDDEDAVERLQERIAGLEAERDQIKAYNATCRKGSPDTSLLTEQDKKCLLSVLKYTPYQSKGGAFPSYHLSNLTGNITRNRKRLEQLLRED